MALPVAARVVSVGPGLLVNLDQVKREKYLRTWERALGGRISETGTTPVATPRVISAASP